jgi:hypothetical protein
VARVALAWLQVLLDQLQQVLIPLEHLLLRAVAAVRVAAQQVLAVRAAGVLGLLLVLEQVAQRTLEAVAGLPRVHLMLVALVAQVS